MKPVKKKSGGRAGCPNPPCYDSDSTMKSLRIKQKAASDGYNRTKMQGDSKGMRRFMATSDSLNSKMSDRYDEMSRADTLKSKPKMEKKKSGGMMAKKTMKMTAMPKKMGGMMAKPKKTGGKAGKSC